MDKFIKNFSNIPDIKILEQIIKLKPNVDDNSSKKKKNLHGKVIIEKMGGEEAIPEFIKMWRQHFLDSMKPKHLPNNWSVGHSIERSFGKKSKFHTE